MKPIVRTSKGIVDYCLDNVERIEADETLDIATKTKLGLACLKEARGYVLADLQFRRDLAKAPVPTADPTIVLPIGTGAPIGLKAAAPDPEPETDPEQTPTALAMDFLAAAAAALLSAQTAEPRKCAGNGRCAH